MLKDVRLLELGVNGFDLATILPLLQPLQHLESLSISENAVLHNYQPFDEITSQAAIDFLGASPSIRFLRLPHQLKHYWANAEVLNVRNAAEERRVDFNFA